MNVFLFAILLLISSSAIGQNYDNAHGIQFISKSLSKEKPFTRSGSLFGLTHIPENDQFYIKIINYDDHDKSVYSNLICSLSLVKEFNTLKQAIELEFFYLDKGILKKAQGEIEDINIYPGNGYIVIVTNDKYIKKWNLMTCTIK